MSGSGAGVGVCGVREWEIYQGGIRCGESGSRAVGRESKRRAGVRDWDRSQGSRTGQSSERKVSVPSERVVMVDPV